MSGINQYKSAEVNTSDGVKIVSMLYDGAINFTRIARKRMGHGDIAGKGLYIGKATAVIAELNSSLNMESGGEIAENLRRLYDFVLDRLLQANVNNDVKAIDDVERVLEILQGAWKELERGGMPQVVDAPMDVTESRVGIRA